MAMGMAAGGLLMTGALWCLMSQRAQGSGLIVHTRDGRVSGAPVTWQGHSLRAFYAIPFALPPLEELRFQPPINPRPWKHILSAAQGMSAPCMQRLGESRLPIHVKSLQNASEDCLYLNVWTPAKDDKKWPVVVVIHGGFFSTGSTSSPLYDGLTLAAIGKVVVVSMNYRLGVFGFLDASHKDAPGNVGLQDQKLALIWVKRNVAFFGGDPGRVTLLGVSGGAVSVGAHLASPGSRGLFHAAVIDGACAYSPGFVESSYRSLIRANKLATIVGCARLGMDLNSHPGKVLLCLRTKPAAEILLAQEEVAKNDWTSFYVTYGNPVLPKRPQQSKHLNVPLLIGTASNEGSIFISPRPQDTERVSNRSEALKYATTLLSQFDIQVPSTGARLEPYLTDTPKDPRTLASDIFGDAVLQCPCQQFAADHAASGNQVYVYRFCYPTPSLNVPEWMGVPHSAAFWFISGVPLRMSDRFQDEDKQLSHHIIRLLGYFAKHKNPGTFLEHDWPAFTSKKDPIMHLHPSTPGMRQDERSRYCEYWTTA
ncbi:cholinesterase-like [Ornithodoros turicata]|uniref:cholinesterase-like n=1 Tax=Ornithodoros turicata TaxID=34597 RepID=UPI0031392A1E